MAASAELRAVAKYLRGAESRVARLVKPVVTKGAVNVKKNAVRNLRGQLSSGGRQGGSSIWMLPLSITYDLTDGGWGAEIGPDQSISGMGGAVEFGSANHGPMPYLFPAAAEEESKFQDAVEQAFGDAWEKLP